MEKFFLINPQIRENSYVSRGGKVTLFQRNIVLQPKIFLVWHWCCLNQWQCNVTDKNQLLLLLYLGSSMKMGVGTETSEFRSGYADRVMMEVGVYF